MSLLQTTACRMAVRAGLAINSEAPARIDVPLAAPDRAFLDLMSAAN